MPSERIKGLREFHESYYEHSCTLHERNRDVLKTDITGNLFRSKFKRWWYDLFLVSYSDERSRTYYTSSEAMRLDRTRQFRNFKGRIHPLSKFRNFWYLMMLMLFIVNKILFHHNTSIVHGKISRTFYVAGPIIEIIIIADVFINIKTGYTSEEARSVILNKYEGVLHYCSTKLFLHVASAIPLQWIMILRYGSAVDCELCKANLFILTLRLIGIFGLLRIYEYSSYWTRQRNSFCLTSFFRFLRVFIMSLLTVLYIQDLCDKILLMIMVGEGNILERSYMGEMIFAKFVNPNPPSTLTMYLFSFVRASKSMIRSNFNTKKDYHLDKLVIIMTNVIVHLFYLWSVLEIYAFISGSYFCENKYYKIKSDASNFARYRQLPDQITKKLMKYHDFNHAYMRAIEVHNIMYKTLPQILKNDIFLTAYNHNLKRIPYFCKWPSDVIQEIGLLFKEDIYLNDDLVAEPWVQSDGLMVVAVGELAVYNGDEERGHLIDGDFFGELSLVTDNELRTSKVVAITSCVVLLLDKIVFRRYIRQYPELFLALKQQLIDKYNQNTENERFSSQNLK